MNLVSLFNVVKIVCSFLFFFAKNLNLLFPTQNKIQKPKIIVSSSSYDGLSSKYESSHTHKQSTGILSSIASSSDKRKSITSSSSRSAIESSKYSSSGKKPVFVKTIKGSNVERE